MCVTKTLNGFPAVSVQDDTRVLCTPNSHGSSATNNSDSSTIILPKTKKSVSFKPTCTCRFAKPLSSFTKEEIQAAWYSQDEFKAIRNRAAMQIQRMERLIVASSGSRNRGLEVFAKKRMAEKNEIREDAVWAVLHEQQCQWALGGVGRGPRTRDVSERYSKNQVYKDANIAIAAR